MIRSASKLSYEPIIYNPHTLPPMVPHSDGTMIGCFIDIGMRNMALRFSRYYPSTRKIEGLICTKYDFDLSKGCAARKSELAARPSLGRDQDQFSQLTQQFMALKETFSTCHYIVMERQIGTATGNVESSMYTLGLLSSIIMNNGSRPIIVKLDARVKTKMLDMPRGSEPKAWCLSKSIEILDNNIGQYDKDLKLKLPQMPTSGSNKSYDIADVICYDEVWWRNYVEKGRIDIPK